MHNLGFYIPVISKGDLNVEIFEALNGGLVDNKLRDACVFYDDVDFNPVLPKFGMFNGTDIWFFKGTLISTSLTVCNTAKNAVNKFKLYHLYNDEEKNLIQLLSISDGMKFVTRSDKETKELYRITGKKPVIQVSNMQDLVSRLGELE